MIQLIMMVLLFFVIFFGVAFILNMLLRATWLMSFLYPVIMIIIIDNLPISAYFTAPKESVAQAFERLVSITAVDWVVLVSGFIGTIVSGIVIKFLRKSGYQMF